jgi:hypothetical protein
LQQNIELTHCELDPEKEVFRLARAFEAGSFDPKDDLDLNFICTPPEEEATILAKQKAIEADWEGTEFAFALFKA